jgi:hypothetical protein
MATHLPRWFFSTICSNVDIPFTPYLLIFAQLSPRKRLLEHHLKRVMLCIFISGVSPVWPLLVPYH